MNSGSVVQIGGAVRHSPLPPLINFAHNNDEDDDEEDVQNISRDAHNSVIGGFIGEGYLAWRAIGATIEVFDAQSCIRQAAWTFGAMLHYTSPVITCVCGIGIGPVTHIVIGVDLGAEQTHQGMVGILSLRRSRIIRAFRFQHKVTNVCMVTGGEKVVDPSTLALELRSCQGLLAVATEHASLYLVDLALDLGDEITSDEISPAAFVEICVPDSQADLKRNKIISSRSHPILCLSDNMNNGKMFRLLGPDDHILYEASSQCVNITSLMYIPQLASLVVGYSFGSFQLINLNLITIDCASPYEENMPPVFSFAYQEPENDPKSFVYLWVCRSQSSEYDYDNDGPSSERSTCSLYSMHYEKKEWIEGHGLWYQSLLSMSPRFSFKAVGGIGEKVYNSSPSKLISAMSVSGTTPLSNLTMPLSGIADDALSFSNEEAEPVPELSLCLFCWEANVLTQGKILTQHYIAIFDINQWYQSQMPSQLRLEANELCAYMSFHILDKVPSSVDESLLGGMSLRGSWSRHSSRAPCDKMWYPSALSYEFNLLTSESLATYHCRSVQQSTISALLQQGPGAIVHPSSAFKMCLFSGILSNIDNILNGGGSITVSEREHILNTALEYHLLSLLTQCIVEFSEGRFSHLGCTSQLLMDWAWNKLKEIKNASNTLCFPLLSPAADGAAPLSVQNLISLHQNFTYLSHLSTILASIRDNAGEITTLGAGELEGRVQIANLLKLYLQVILWFYHCGLLPQFSPEDALEDSSVPFPADVLNDLYEKRRKDIKESTGSEILLIDSIVEDCGKLLAEYWDKERSEGGGRGEGTLYPPTSLHSVLSMYLLPGISSHTKHRIVQYLFLDLSSILSENYSNVLEELVKFPSSFSLSPSHIKLTQAFWLIDNKDFQAGLAVLLDPLVNPNDITQEQHRRIVKAFLYQGEEGHALTYTQIRKPPKCELEDIRINLTILLANGRIRESFHYQRKHRVSSNAKQLLNHMFLGCEQLGRLESIVHLPLSPEEEECFVSYLKASKDRSAQDILLIYYLQKSRYTEISSFHESTSRNNSVANSYKRQHEHARSAIVQGYMSHLPDVRTQMQSGSQKLKPSRSLYTKPQPFSAHIRQSSSGLKTPKTKFSSAVRSSHLHLSGASKSSFTPYTPFRSKAQRRKAIQSWNEEMGLELPKETRKEAELDSTRIVFPSYSHDSSVHAGVSTSPIASTSYNLESALWNRTSSRAKEATPLQESITKMMENVLRKSLNLPTSFLAADKNTSLGNLSITQDVISLLKTPPVKHSRSMLNASSNSLAETPQSILKVRKILEQSKTVSETESPVPSFPRHRLSVRKNSLKKVDSVAESSIALTPKQLRFDLPSNCRFSMDEVVENKDENILEEEDRLMLSSVQKKRKRGDSPPTQHSLSRIALPRKPLPRYSSTKDSSLHLRFGLSCSDSEEEVENKVEKSINNSVVVEERSSLHANRSENKSILTTTDDSSTCEEHLITDEQEPLNSSESFLDESFHSVEEYEEEVTIQKPSADDVERKTLRKYNNENSNNFLVSELNIKETSQNASSTTTRFTVEERSETLIESDKFSNSEKYDNTLSRVEICSANVSVSETSIVRETLLLSGSENSNRTLTPKTCNNVNDVKLPDSSIYNKLSSINKHLVEDKVVNSIHSLNNKENFRTLVNSEEEETIKTIERIETNKPLSKMNEAIKTSNDSVIHRESNICSEDVQMQGNDDNDVSYVLKFSDSEDEDTQSLKRESSINEDKSLSNVFMIPSLSKQDTILAVDSSKSLSKADTVVLAESSSKSLSTSKPVFSSSEADYEVDVEDVWDPSLNTTNMAALPSDLVSAKPLRLTTQERELVDEMLMKNPLSFNNFNSNIEKDSKISSLNKSIVPVLEFSDDEETEKTETHVTTNGVRDRVDGYTSDDSEKTVEFDISEFSPAVTQTNSDSVMFMEVDDIENQVSSPSTEVYDNVSSSEGHINVVSAEKVSKNIPPVEEAHENVSSVEEGHDNAAVSAKEVSKCVPSTEDHENDVSAEVSKCVPSVEDVKESVPSTEITPVKFDEADSFMLNRQLQEKDNETLLYMANISDNNNIQKEALAQTPLKEKSLIQLTPSRRTRHLSGLSTDDIITTNTPVTPLRRSTRLNSSTPSKIEITPLRRRRRTSGVSDIVEDASQNIVPSVEELKLPTSEMIASSLIDTTPMKAMDTEDTKILLSPSRRRRRISASSDTDEGASKMLTTPSRRRRRASGLSEASEVANVVEEETGSKSALEERLGLCTPMKEIRSKEKASPLITSRLENDLDQEINTPVKRLDTPRRRSARLGGVKENLGTIIEDTSDSRSSVTPKTITPVKMTPKRSTRKSVQNVPVIEPILETINEDSELSSTDSAQDTSLPKPHLEINSEASSNTTSKKSTTPSNTTIASSLRRSRRKSISESPEQVIDSDTTQLPVLEQATTPIAQTPVTISSLRRARRTSGSDAAEHTSTTHQQELPQSEEAAFVTPSRQSRRKTEAGTSASNESIIIQTEAPSELLNTSSVHENNKVVLTRKTAKHSQLSSLEQPPLLSNSSMNSVASDMEETETADVLKPNYTVISPDETCVNATVRVMRRYSEKHVNSVLSNSKHSTSIRRKSIKGLSIPAGFEFSAIETPVREMRSRKKRGTFHSNMEEEEENVFEDGIEHRPHHDASCNDVEDRKNEDLDDPSPSPVYKLLEGGDVGDGVLPRKASKAKSKFIYRKRIVSMKSLNRRIKDSPEEDIDERPIKKIKNGLAPSQEEEYAEDRRRGLTDEDKSIKGFTFQNPQVISAAEAVSEVFDQLTKDHERIVSETFVFSPPFSLSENRRKKIRESSRNSRK